MVVSWRKGNLRDLGWVITSQSQVRETDIRGDTFRKSQTNVKLTSYRKLMKRKTEMLQGLAKLKPDSGLYISHQRVLIKQCLEDIREMNNEL